MYFYITLHCIGYSPSIPLSRHQGPTIPYHPPLLGLIPLRCTWRVDVSTIGSLAKRAWRSSPPRRFPSSQRTSDQNAVKHTNQHRSNTTRPPRDSTTHAKPITACQPGESPSSTPSTQKLEFNNTSKLRIPKRIATQANASQERTPGQIRYSSALDTTRPASDSFS